MRYVLLVMVGVLMIPVLAQEDTDATPLVGWQDGVVVVWASPSAQPEPLYPADTPRIPEPDMLSPDGVYVVYALTDDGITDGVFPEVFDGRGFVLHELATGMEQVITESDDAVYSRNVIWSPDSTRVAWVRAVYTETDMTFVLEVYDLATEEVIPVSDNYYTGYRDGGAGTLAPAAPSQWTGDVLVQRASGYDTAFGGFAEIVIAYNVQSGEQTLISPGVDGILIMPTHVLSLHGEFGERQTLYATAFGFVYNYLITVGEDVRRIPHLITTPQLRARNAPDNALTFLPYIDRGGYKGWMVQHPDGTLDALEITADWDAVFPTPDGRGLLYATGEGVNDYALWHIDSTELPRFEAIPLWDTHDWIIPDCPQARQFSFLSQVVSTQVVDIYGLPQADPWTSIPARYPVDVLEGSLCVDGVNWLQVSIRYSDQQVVGWMPETDGTRYTLVSVEE